MTRRQQLATVCFVLAATRVWAATPRDAYVNALARERAVRAELAMTDAPPQVAVEARAVLNAYREVVRLYPASGYADNALWQAGRLSLDLFFRFHQAQDRTTGVRLLHALTSAYPTSKLVKQVPEQLARVTGAPVQPTVGNAPAVPLATLTAIRRTVLGDTVRITIELDGEVSFHEERIVNPLRVFVDLPATRAASTLLDRTVRFDGDDDIVRQVRIGRHSNDTTRVVVDAAGVSSYSVYPLYNPYRLVIDCVRGAEPSVAILPLPSRTFPARWDRVLPSVSARATRAIADALTALAETSSNLLSRQLQSDWGRTLPATTPRATIAEALRESAAPSVGALSPSPETSPAPITPAPITPETIPGPPKRLTGGYSMARQLGLSVSRIVIDPGHGGHDPGAHGKSVDEAELVLDVALRLEKLLLASPGTEVILTRRTDQFVSLPERTAIANRENADLFLSIHANANDNAVARGVETYFLNFATNMSAASVAARENAASGQSMAALPDLVKSIALNNKLDESRDFAAAVQRAMVNQLRMTNKTVKDLGVKQAPFAVLIGAAMPSVLAEISFITNPQEERLLRGSMYRQRIAEALYNAVRTYQMSLKSSGKVAQGH